MVVINCSAEGHTSVRKIASGDAILEWYNLSRVDKHPKI